MNCFQTRSDVPPRTSWLQIWNYVHDTIFQKTKEWLLDIWAVYSKPVPENRKEVCSLLSVCLCITVLSGGLLYNWMFSSLQYNFKLCLGMSAAFSCVLLLLLVLVHPIRCILTISVPILGTKQGRRLLLSTCFLIITFDIIPNIAHSIRTIVHILKCISQNSAESLLNSTALLEQAAQEFGQAVSSVTAQLKGGGVKFYSSVNTSAVRNQMLKLSENIRNDFSQAEILVKETTLITNRIFASFFVVCLLFQSASYLKSYLTDLKFDNIYITKRLEQLAQKCNKTDILTSTSKGLIKSTGWKLSKEEYLSCLLHILILSLYCMITAMIIVMDHIAFHLAVATRAWADNFPTVPMALEIKYKVQLSFFTGSFVVLPTVKTHSFEQKYQRDLTFVSSDCVLCPNVPNNTVVVTVVLIYCIICALIFLQTYAHRLCRKISASFFEKQEKARVKYLFQKILQNNKKKQNTML